LYAYPVKEGFYKKLAFMRDGGLPKSGRAIEIGLVDEA
jgi:hypothetical protein